MKGDYHTKPCNYNCRCNTGRRDWVECGACPGVMTMRHRIVPDNTDAIMKTFTPDRKREHPPTDVWNECVRNWWELPAQVRTRCVRHLHDAMVLTDYGRELLVLWANQVRDGMEPGSDDLRFHFGTGMTVRNVLWQVVQDAELPPIAYDGHVAQNWDDYYFGAIEQLVKYGTAEIHSTRMYRPAAAEAIIPDYPFTTDGCSGGMTAGWKLVFRQDPPWNECCVTHDRAYWRGGTRAERRTADRELMKCVTENGHPVFALLMWLAVRVGGHPLLPLSWRWGYGWRWPRSYAPQLPRTARSHPRSPPRT